MLRQRDTYSGPHLHCNGSGEGGQPCLVFLDVCAQLHRKALPYSSAGDHNFTFNILNSASGAIFFPKMASLL